MTYKNFILELQMNDIARDTKIHSSSYPDSSEFNSKYDVFDSPINIHGAGTEFSVRYHWFSRNDLYVVPWIKSTKNAIGLIHLYKRPAYNKFKVAEIFEVKNVYLKKDYIGYGIIPLIYKELVIREYNIAALDTQSPGAVKMWKKFYTDKGMSKNMHLWFIYGLRFFEDPKMFRSKKDYIESILVSDRFVKDKESSLSVVMKTEDGVESVRSVYSDSEIDYIGSEMTSLLVTKRSSELDNMLTKMADLEDFPEEEQLYNTLSALLLRS